MKKTSEKIIYFGSGDLAAKSLELLSQDFDFEAVITKPKKNNIQKVLPVFDVAKKLSIPTYFASNKSEVNSLFENNTFKANIGLLIDFGIIISDQTISKFKFGIVNSHFSVLPQWRGPDPITYTILSGQHSAGVSLMKIVEKMDEGPLLSYREININDTIINEELADELIYLSHNLINDTLPDFIDGKIELIDQSLTGKIISYSKIIKKTDGTVDFNKTAQDIERQIRAFSTWPKTRFNIDGVDVIITKAYVLNRQGNPGDFFITNDSYIGFCCIENSLIIEEMLPAGRKKMSSKNYLIGHPSLFEKLR